MNAVIDRGRQGNERVPATIVHTWGGWPWRAQCEVCTTRSPGQRTHDDARKWADSHYHAFHEIG